MAHVSIIGGAIGYRLLRHLRPEGDETGTYCANHDYNAGSKLEQLFGLEVWRQVSGKRVLDFGCGMGNEVVEIARHGASRVVGLDSRERMLDIARAAATAAGVLPVCDFTKTLAEPFDVIFSIDGFEHYDKPAQVLEFMERVLAPGGRILICFGPPWLHPYGGHLFSVFPWAHLVFTEKALLRWRADFKSDGATRFDEVEGGLNQMTVGRFRRLVIASGFFIESFRAIPIRKLRWLSNPLTRECFTSSVLCTLVRQTP
jgi:SAM-dependent methyltransferase